MTGSSTQSSTTRAIPEWVRDNHQESGVPRHTAITALKVDVHRLSRSAWENASDARPADHADNEEDIKSIASGTTSKPKRNTDGSCTGQAVPTCCD